MTNFLKLKESGKVVFLGFVCGAGVMDSDWFLRCQVLCNIL